MLIKVVSIFLLYFCLANLGFAQSPIFHVVSWERLPVTRAKKEKAGSKKREEIKDFSLEKGQVVFNFGADSTGGIELVIYWRHDLNVMGFVPEGGLIPTKSLQLKRPKDYDFSDVYAEDWFVIMLTDDETIEIDPSRMKKTGDVISYWTRWVEGGQTNSMVKDEVRCATNESRQVQSTVYREKTKGRWTKLRSLKSSSNPYAAFEEVTPESVGEGMLKSVCSL